MRRVRLPAALLGDELVLQGGLALRVDALEGVARGGADVACAAAAGGYYLYLSAMPGSGLLLHYARGWIVDGNLDSRRRAYPVKRLVPRKLAPALMPRCSRLRVDAARRRADEVARTASARRHLVISFH